MVETQPPPPEPSVPVPPPIDVQDLEWDRIAAALAPAAIRARMRDTVEQLETAFADSDYNLRELLITIATTDAFRYRAAE